MSELPEGWELPALGDVVKITQGNSTLTKKKYKADGKFVAFSGSGADGFVDDYEHEGEAIILSSVGARCGKCFKASGQWTAIANTAIIRLHSQDEVLFNYLFYLLNDENFWLKGGSAQPFVQTGLSQRELKIPLPPLNEQRRIVAKLERLLGLVAAAQARLATLPRTLKQFRQSILAAACSSKLTADWRKEPRLSETAATLLTRVRLQRRERWTQAEMAKQTSKGKTSTGKRADKYPDPRKIVDDDLPDLPEQWVWVSLDEVSHRLTYGITVRPEYVEDGVSMISAREIRSGEVDLLKANRISRSDYDGLREKCRIYFGDVLFSKTGTIGSVARVKTAEPLCSSQNIAVISPLIESAFLEIVLRSSTFQQRAQGAVKNTAVSDLQLGIMARFPIPIPPLIEQ